MVRQTSPHGNDPPPVDYDLTCWYLNQRRVIELLSALNLAADIKAIMASTSSGDALQQNMVLSLLKDGLTNWLHAANPPTLGRLIVTGKLQLGTVFTHYANYYCKGLPQVREALHTGSSPVPMAEAYAKLDGFQPGQKISFRFHHEHLTSNSSWSQLSGQRRLLVLGAATSIADDLIEAIPWIIANPLPDLFRPCTVIGEHWNYRLEVHVDSIDSFARVRDVPPPRGKAALDRLRDIREQDIKTAFAEIIGEPDVPKDWGGERSDLFSTWVRLNGERISTAFAFKGRAKFHPMKMADLGKNGDQINRLFTEPAQLLVLQHCHQITPEVREMMRAFAQQMGNPRLFCLIDGYDTLRLLQAYGKCNF